MAWYLIEHREYFTFHLSGSDFSMSLDRALFTRLEPPPLQPVFVLCVCYISYACYEKWVKKTFQCQTAFHVERCRRFESRLVS
jgi:hypothetical protein